MSDGAVTGLLPAHRLRHRPGAAAGIYRGEYTVADDSEARKHLVAAFAGRFPEARQIGPAQVHDLAKSQGIRITVGAAALLEAFAASGRLPAAQCSSYFQVAINDSVARSLNLVVDDSVRELAHRPAGTAP